MGVLSKYTKEQILKMDKKKFMEEASYDDMMTDFGIPLKTILLCRESTSHEDQKVALARQEERMTDFVTSHKQFCLIENGTFIEDGKSGLAMNKRPDFKRMIDTAIEQEADVIVVQEATRFSRNVGEFFSLNQLLETHGVGIIIREGEYWTYYMKPNDITRLASEVAKGEAEVKTTSNRVKNGVDSYRKNGQLVQGSMFGYDLKRAVLRKDNTYTIEPIKWCNSTENL